VEVDEVVTVASSPAAEAAPPEPAPPPPPGLRAAALLFELFFSHFMSKFKLIYLLPLIKFRFE
jgi:hypothetical protein